MTLWTTATAHNSSKLGYLVSKSSMEGIKGQGSQRYCCRKLHWSSQKSNRLSINGGPEIYKQKTQKLKKLGSLQGFFFFFFLVAITFPCTSQDLGLEMLHQCNWSLKGSQSSQKVTSYSQYNLGKKKWKKFPGCPVVKTQDFTLSLLGVRGSIPSQETKILQATWHSQKKRNENYVTL